MQTIQVPVFKLQRKTIVTNGYAYPFISQTDLTRSLEDLTYVSPFSYGITAEGGLIENEDDRILSVAKQYGVAPLLVLTPLNEQGQFSNELASQLLNNPQAQETLLNNVLAKMKEKGYRGLDFDFEYVYEEDKDNYVELVRKAAEKLRPEGYIVTVALAPKTSADQPGLLYAGHDYPGMGAAANYALLMTYEWGYTYGPPMAVSPIDKMRQVLDYGVSEIPPEKILLGMPNYGYDWTLPYVRGTSKAESIANTEAEARAARYGAQILYDEVSQTPHYNYTDAQGQQHEVWFDNERSIQAKLNLINEYGLAGVSFWNLHRYNPENWAVLRDLYEIKRV